jgi:tRNA nucleotidyltransferase/poly(A) polymerase
VLIKEKVSEERIGTEMDKMLEGLKAAQAIEDLHRLDLLKLIYRLPSSQTEYL